MSSTKGNNKTKKKIVYILAYRDPEYIRTKVLLKAISEISDIELITIINKNRGFNRYFEVISRLIITRFRDKPDGYILGFRGHEILGIVRLISLGKPLIFDEFLNMQDWLTKEQKKLKENSLLSKIIKNYFSFLLSRVEIILTDTMLHAQSSSKTYSVPLNKYKTIYVGTDEQAFTPIKNTKHSGLNVFFYGNMIPLHGIEYILESANLLKNKKINFRIVGGKGRPEIIQFINNYIEMNNLENIDYSEWIEFSKLPAEIAKSDICLAGPFGGTTQSNRVITGKAFQFLSMAKPAVIGKIDEDIGFIDKNNCLLVDQASTKDLASAILWASNNKPKLSFLGLEGKKFYDKKFSGKVVKDKLESIIGSI